MLSNDDKLIIENVIKMMNQSPWNKKHQLVLQDVYSMCESEDMYDVLDILRQEDVERQKNYQK